jgi:hypothetical protein
MKAHAPDRTQRPVIPEPAKRTEDPGPMKPNIKKPSEDNELLKRLRKIDPDQAKKYRQRSGE